MTKIDADFAIQDILARGPGLTVFGAVDEAGQRHRLVAKGVIRAPGVGETWHVAGRLERHPAHGRQIAVRTMHLTVPVGRLIRTVLAGPHFPGVGEAAANKLWHSFQGDLTNILDAKDFGKLLDVLGDHPRGQEQAITLVERWPEITTEHGLVPWADRLGISASLLNKLLACYGSECRRKVEDDPYRLLAFCDWVQVDGIAMSMGIFPNDPRRQVAACEAAMYAILNDGDTWADDAAIGSRVGRILGAAAVDAAIEAARAAGALIRAGDGWQAAGPAIMEADVAARLVDRIGEADPVPWRRAFDVAAFLTRWQRESQFQLNDGQIQAVEMSLSQRLSIVTGGAGVGKTTALRAIFDAAIAAGLQVEPMALSGRASLRIREATGRDARTVAGWLALAERKKIELRVPTLVVIDEASMIDLASFYRILRTLTPECRLLLVGDPGQLPPIGFGLTLHVLQSHPEIPQVELTQVLRQAAETGIPAVAAAIRHGRMPNVDPYEHTAGVGVFLSECGKDEIASRVVSIRRSLTDCQVVGSIKGQGGSDGGTVGINRLLHDAFVSARGNGEALFARGEPVIWTVNDYDLELWNGSLGRVSGPGNDDPTSLNVIFDEGPRTIPAEILHHLDHAWAITTHKAQGSSFDTVIVPIVPSIIMDATLLYTAVTRARRRVIFVGSAPMLERIAAAPARAAMRGNRLSFGITAALARRSAGIGH